MPASAAAIALVAFLAPISARTVTVALVVHRDGARLVAYTVKERPFFENGPASPRSAGSLALELHGPDGAFLERRHELRGLCLEHPRDTPPHVVGDTTLLHEDSLVVELPELPGFDRISVAYDKGGRRHLGTWTLDALRFDAAGGRVRYDDLAFAVAGDREPTPPAAPTAATVHWPEEFGDPDVVKLYGQPSEIGQRINVVIVPDGYRYSEKAIMETHAAAVVASFRAKTPYAEHDRFFNYVLVYAYSEASGTDECDCGSIVNTAMGTYFPGGTGICGHSDNRCLYYGSSDNCDTDGLANIASAELRAPARDETIVMVNTSRYGGCAGDRAVIAAGHLSAADLATHELSHSFNGLDDEYDGMSACGSLAGEVNTSRNGSTGAWSEWIDDLGPPWEGAQHYNRCLYRPTSACQMRALGVPFCPVCTQHLALGVLGQSRVSPTAPIRAFQPGSPINVAVGGSIRFAVTTRLAQSPSVITWSLTRPSNPVPEVVLTGPPVLDYVFAEIGEYRVESEVITDINFIKPERYGPNRDVASWTVRAATCTGLPDTDGDGVADACDNCPDHANASQGPVVFGQAIVASDRDTLSWSAPADVVYVRGPLASVSSYGIDQLGGSSDGTSLGVPGIPASGAGYYYLVRLGGNCAVSSWQSVLGREPGRDLNLP